MKFQTSEEMAREYLADLNELKAPDLYNTILNTWYLTVWF